MYLEVVTIILLVREVIKRYFDLELLKWLDEGTPLMINKIRAEELAEKNLIKIL